ncbi:MAG: DNA helicase II [Gammaproteobacteria bacterium]
MMSSPLLDPLNAAQRRAVAAEPGSILVLAGAGSGKTRVLTHRIAWLIEYGHASPHGILAVTFTNKAAAEMRARIDTLLQTPARQMWVGTFHGIAHRLLRAHSQAARLPSGFQILDSEDQLRLIRRTIRALELDENTWVPRELQWFINAKKDEGLRAADLQSAADRYLDQQLRIYRAYETACERAGLVDFAELLLRAHELWRDHPELLAHYQQRFRHVLVDEFQDTNTIQYAWIRRLTGEAGHVFAVGDDDQSIYSWRGARVENMQRFQRDYPGTELIRLEQNYRSTATILGAANALIAHNRKRLGKALWTAGTEGEPIALFAAFNEHEEARFCIEQVRSWRAAGRRYDDCAILYRTSAQSRVFEEALHQRRIPYRVHGGFKFYERAEIRDVLAYLRLLDNRDDDASFERVINTPNRGIGQRSLELIREQHTRRDGLSLWRAVLALLQGRELAARAVLAVQGFLDLIERLSAECRTLALGSMVETVIKRTQIAEHYRKEKREQAIDRQENLDELVSAASRFVPEEGSEMDPLAAFLAHAALEAGEAQADEFQDSVQLMTLHAAKGLEYPLVFIAGLEEGLFPHQRSAMDATQLEEERRLCYVGITRAKERLVLSHAEARRLHGSDHYPRPSRFLDELPGALIAEVRYQAKPVPLASNTVSARVSAPARDIAGLRLGQRVRHAKFGEGIVLQLEGDGEHTRVLVNFAGVGQKLLVAAYAGLQGL